MASATKPPPLNVDVLIQVTLARMLFVMAADLLTRFRACLPANAVENADADAIRCYPSAGKRCSRYLLMRLTDSYRQCTKAGVDCVFYDHGRKELLPRR
jgi:hypothetical protein